MVLTCLGLGGLTYGAHLVALPAPPVLLTAVLLIGSVALLTAAALHLRRTAFPLLNLRTLGVPTFRVTHRPASSRTGSSAARCRSCCR